VVCFTGGCLNKVKFVHGLNAPRQQFVDNIATNLCRGLPTLQTRRAIVVGGGPSVADHVDDIKRHQAKGWEITAVNGAHDWLIGQGITPDACVLMDATEALINVVKRPSTGCRYYVASQCHPQVFERLKGFDVMLWHARLDAEADEQIWASDPDATIFAAANTAGLHALAINYTLGVKKLRVYGMDSSHSRGADHAYDNSQQHHSDEIEFFFKGERFLSTGTYAAQAEMFARFWPQYFRLGMRIDVVGDGLLPAMARHEKEKLMAKLKGN
jgi:hypothetical protein